MGSSHSADIHKVTIQQEEEEAFNVVNVSETLARSLGGHSRDNIKVTKSDLTRDKLIRQASEPSAEDSVSAAEFKVIQAEYRNLADQLNQSERKLNSALREVQDLRQKQGLLSEHTPTKLKDSESIKKLEENYTRKLAETRDRIEALQKEASEALKAKVEATSVKAVNPLRQTACADLESRVHRCYLGNPGKTLNCTQLAREYMDCVQSARDSQVRKEVNTTTAEVAAS